MFYVLSLSLSVVSFSEKQAMEGSMMIRLDLLDFDHLIIIYSP